MKPFSLDQSANPASSHRPGQRARKALEDAREQVGSLLDAYPDEVIFTSGATEANNLAIFGLALEPGHILASPMEHPCVTEPLNRLTERGFQLDWLAVSREGVVDLQSCNIQPQTRLACLMLANHETGALQPVKELSEVIGDRAAIHCDAAAASGKVSISFHDLGVTSLTVSAHKFLGPTGIGALLLRRHSKFKPLFHGGHQQQGRRPGTEPVALAVGMATALNLACAEMKTRCQQVHRLRQVLLDELRNSAAPLVLNGPEENGIPHIVNLSFPGCRADVLLMNLDLAGIACATGSACSSGSLLPSPVLKAMNVPEEVLQSAMRFSFSHLLIEAEVIEAARRIAEVVKRLRGN
jgi:cysteine desulfurase